MDVGLLLTVTNLYSIGNGGDLGTATPQREILLQPRQFIESEVTGVATALGLLWLLKRMQLNPQFPFFPPF